jgi:hypothetical protein
MDLFGEKNGPSIIMEYDVYRNNYIDIIKRGGEIRLITEITKENLHYCKELRKIVTFSFTLPARNMRDIYDSLC